MPKTRRLVNLDAADEKELAHVRIVCLIYYINLRFGACTTVRASLLQAYYTSKKMMTSITNIQQ